MNNDSSDHGRQFIIPIILTVLTIILGFVSFEAVFPDYPFSRKLYYTFQLFTLESGDRFYENGAQPLWVVIVFNFSRFLAVATLVVTIVLAILSVIRYKFFLSRVRFKKDHTILCGLGDIGKAIADNFKDKSQLLIIEKNTDNEDIVRLKNKGAKIIGANALDTTILGKLGIRNATSFLATTGDDFDNLTIINHALELLREKDSCGAQVRLAANINSRNLKAAVTEEWQKGTENSNNILRESLYKFYNVANELSSKVEEGRVSPGLKEQFEALKNTLEVYNPQVNDQGLNSGNIKLFNINQMAGRYIFLHYPPDRFRRITHPDDKPMKILFLGFSNIGEEILKLCFQNCHYINRKNTKITLVVFEGIVIRERIRSKYKNIDKLIDLNIVDHNPHYITSRFLYENDLKDIDVIYICSSEDRYQASYSSRARELFGEKTPVIRPFYKKNVLCRIENQGNTYSFNIFGRVANRENIIDESLDHKAIAVHNRWMRQAISDYISKAANCISNQETVPMPKTTMAPWYLVDEEIHEDNRSVVDHINVKLRSVNQLTDPGFFTHPEDANIDYGFLLDESKINQLAEMEHRRWMANRFICGWVYDEQRNDSEKKHDCLKDFDLLDENSKNYDRQQIKDMNDIIELTNNQKPDRKDL
jgi:TrkA-N domain/RyR domain